MSKKKFLICPVRNQTPEIVETIEKAIQDPDVYYPKRDTDQNDPTGLNICRQNGEAIKAAEEVLFIWDGNSQGCLFDLGMAFSMGKKITVVHVPPLTEGKSFQNMITAYAESTSKNCRSHCCECERLGPNLECGPEKTAVTINGDEFEADTEMIPLLKELNKVGLTTTQHCAGHSEGDTAYLSLEMKSDMEVGIRYDVKPRLVITWKKT